MDSIAFVVYSLGGLGWLYIWRLLVGYNSLKKQPLLYIPFVGGIFVLFVNVVLSFFTIIPDYGTELQLYPYVEHNAKTVASLSLAIAIFVFLKLEKTETVKTSTLSKQFIYLILWSFLLAVIGCLPLYWMPPVDGWLTVLRHLKTVPFTYSIFILSSSIILLICETTDSRQSDI